MNTRPVAGRGRIQPFGKQSRERARRPFRNQGVDGLVVDSPRPPQPPRQADNPLGQDRLQRPTRGQLSQKSLSLGVELGLAFGADNVTLGREPMRLAEGSAPGA